MKTSSSIVTFLLLVACGASRANAGDNNTHAVVDKLAATWAPLAKQTGDARTAAVCAEADKLAGLAKAVPISPPSGSVVDAETWSDDRDAVDAQLGIISDVCKQPGHQRLTLGGQPETAGDLATAAESAVAVLVDAAKRRVLPAGAANFQKTLKATRFPSGRFCAQQKKLASQVVGLTAPPPGVDAAQWATVAKSVADGVAALRCAKPMPPDEELASGLIAVREQLIKLVLLIPAS